MYTIFVNMIIKESIVIDAPVKTVWQVLTEVENWPDWNTVCRECRLEEGDALEEGACLSFELSPLVFPLRIAPVIEAYEEGKKLTWAGSKWGIHARHTFSFSPLDGGCRLESREVFSGILLWAARLTGVPNRLHGLTRRLLSAIKAEAEARGGSS